MEDLLEQANEIQETMGRAYGLPDDIDEDELEAELEALGDEALFEDEEVPSYLQEPEEKAPAGPISELDDLLSAQPAAVRREISVGDEAYFASYFADPGR